MKALQQFAKRVPLYHVAVFGVMVVAISIIMQSDRTASLAGRLSIRTGIDMNWFGLVMIACVVLMTQLRNVALRLTLGLPYIVFTAGIWWVTRADDLGWQSAIQYSVIGVMMLVGVLQDDGQS